MASPDTIQDLLLTDGTSQEQRSLEALGVLYARMDERRTEELLSLIYRYARYVFYYRDDPSNPEGDWQPFFVDNLAFRYAGIQQFPSGDLEKNYLVSRQLFTERITDGSFWPLFNNILDIAFQLNNWFIEEDESPLAKMLEIIIRNDFSKALARLIAVGNTFTVAQSDFSYDLEALRNREAWGLTPQRLLAQDLRLAKLDPVSRRKEVETLAELDDIFQVFNKGLLQVQQYTKDNFEEALIGTGKVAPHLGLLQTFLKLFLSVRDGKRGLNDMTRLHLDFFYKEILGLKHRRHDPDHIHFIVELAKQVNFFLLEKNVVLKDGKDVKGKEIHFLNSEDTVYNKATVDQLRSLFKDAGATIYAAPVANSADGTGTPFQDENNNSWPLLGAKSFRDKNNPGNLTPLQYPFAQTGLVLSSPVLLLNEGKRTISVNIKLGNMSVVANSFAALFTKPLFKLDLPVLAILEKAGVAKELVTTIREKLQSVPANTRWLTADQFESFTGINPPLVDKVKRITFTSLLNIYYSSSKAWLPAPLPIIAFNPSTKWLSILFVLEPSDKPFSILGADLQAKAYPLKNPALKILFDHRLRSVFLKDDQTPWYDVLSHASIEDVFINVQGEKIKNVLLGNDDGLLDGNKKFFPFTGVPKKDSSFYIGSDEIFRKKLTGLKVTAEWDGLPGDFKIHYLGYETPPPNNISFTTSVEKLVNGSWLPLPNLSPNNKFKLFTVQPDPPVNTDHPVVTLNTWAVKELEPVATQPVTFIDLPVLDQPQPLAPFDNNSIEGFIRLKLDRHFYHQEYPFILASSALSVGKFDYSIVQNHIFNTVQPGVYQHSATVQAATIVADNKADSMFGTTPDAAKINEVTGATQDARDKAQDLMDKADKLKDSISVNNKVVILPKPPYTPAIKSFYLDYSAGALATDISLIHLYPYEESNYREIPLAPPSKAYFLPQFNDEGTLYIGLLDATPGSNISLLFQLAAFSANPDIEPANIQYYYLKNNDWVLLKKDIDITSDSTRELLVSGIVNISLPWDADLVHTILPSGYHWLKIATPSSSDAVCEAILVAAQGGRAVFINQENDLTRLERPLPADSITGLLVPRSEIKKISQPYPSFNGRKEEDDNQFYIRVSERLKHKGRAITVFDYERMTLEAFPSVFKVKCIPHTKICRNQKSFKPLSSPGWVTLALIPEISGFSAETRLEPKLTRILLKDVEDFFKNKTSGFVPVQAINPVYLPVDFKGNIRFHPGKDEAFYMRKLKADVRDYLSPWIKGSSRDIVFGGTLMMSSVLQFIELRSYVSYVTDFEMRLGSGVPLKSITASTPWTVLIAGGQEYKILYEDCKLDKPAWALG